VLKISRKSLSLAIFSLTAAYGAEVALQKPLHNFKIEGVGECVFLKPKEMDSLEAKLLGLSTGYEYFRENSFYAKLQATLKRGKLEGSYGYRDLLEINGESRAGYSIAYGAPGSAITFFCGFGYEHSSQELHPIKEKNNTTNLIYQEFYVPLGFMVNHIFNQVVSCKLTALWMPQVYSSVEVIPLGSARWILPATEKNYSIEFAWHFLLSKRIGLTITPFYKHWENGPTNETTPVGLDWEIPGNLYDFYGLKVGFLCNF
jgi:hypothetical protein